MIDYRYHKDNQSSKEAGYGKKAHETDIGYRYVTKDNANIDIII